MNKEIDALVAKCCIGGTDGNYAYADRVRDALLEARALGLEGAAKWHAARADSLMHTRNEFLSSGFPESADRLYAMAREHEESAHVLRVLKGE